MPTANVLASKMGDIEFRIATYIRYIISIQTFIAA